MPELIIENGSGLSRVERISPNHLNQVLLLGLNSSSRDYYVESLPIAGVDGTMKHRLLDNFRKYVPKRSETEALEKTHLRYQVQLGSMVLILKLGL